ncbi:hypothetical protein BS78_10G241400 [Paspalum vaginatum]|nr:hypothetical protein BS78_10G241400 [Paspalum vaginatum]
MTSVTKLADITIGQQNFMVLAQLTRIWDSKNMSSRAPDPFISMDGVVLDEHGAMAHITVPKRPEKQFRPQLTQGFVYIFANLSVVDTKQKTYIYHHQKYMLQFHPNSTVHRLDSRGGNITQFAFNFCPFDQLPSKNLCSKPLIDLIGVISRMVHMTLLAPHQTKNYEKYRFVT